MDQENRSRNLVTSEMRRVYNENRLGGLQAFGNLSTINPGSSTAVPLSSSYLLNPMSSPTSNMRMPPLPPRHSTAMPYNRLNPGMNSYFSPYSRYSSGMYSPMYGGGYRMPHYGAAPHDSFNSFVQMAEESTRPAFESIESVVEVFSSISMMLESTYHAVHSSYSAILGVVDQFSRLKDHLAQMLSILALMRGLRWLCLKVLYILRLRKTNPSDEAVWRSASLEAGTSLVPVGSPGKPSGSAWPFLMFLGLVIGAPWLMFKLLSKSISQKKPIDQSIFKDENGRHLATQAAYDFQATQHGELSFRAGEKLYIAPSSYRANPKGWLYACNTKQETGLIPSTYLLVKRTNPQIPTPAVDASRVIISTEGTTMPDKAQEPLPNQAQGPLPNQAQGPPSNQAQVQPPNQAQVQPPNQAEGPPPNQASDSIPDNTSLTGNVDSTSVTLKEVVEAYGDVLSLDSKEMD